MGKVVLVGAGPGDEGLLTLKGEKYIKEADCLVYEGYPHRSFLRLQRIHVSLYMLEKKTISMS